MDVHQCQCPLCLGNSDHPERLLHSHLNLLLSRLNEPQRRWLVALESERLGRGGDQRLALITGLAVATIRRGRRELNAALRDCPADRLRQPGAGRPALKKKIPAS